MGEILAATPWNTNADMMADVAKLYFRDDDLVLDMTYGLGNFWTKYRPRLLVSNDIDPDTDADHHYDFRRTQFGIGQFDVVVLDPPYKLNGTDQGEGARYGVAGEYRSVEARHQLIRAGITKAARITRTKGYVMLKCQDQVCGGKVHWQTVEFTNHAAIVGLELVDRFDLLGYRPQPAGRKQQHARRNYSSLLVFEKKGNM